MKIIVKARPDSKTVAINATIGFGSNQEKDEHSGIAHFIEHMLFKGTKNRTEKQIVTEVERMGGVINAYTNQKRTYLFILIPAKHFTLGLDIVSDTILNSMFNEKELEKERMVILEEIKRKEDTPINNVWHMFPSTLYKKHPVIRDVLGRLETVQKISRGDLLNYYKKYYVPNNIIISIVGNVNTDEVISKVKGAFRSARRKRVPIYNPPIEQPLIKIQEKIIKKQLDQAHMILSTRFMTLKDEDWPVGDFIHTILGSGASSRLPQEIRSTRGLAYDVLTWYDKFLDYGHFAVYVGTAKRNIKLVKQIILKELSKLKTKKLSKKELDDVKTRIEGLRILEGEDNLALANDLSFFELFDKAEAYDTYLDRIRTITAADVMRVANKYFDENKYAFTAIIPK